MACALLVAAVALAPTPLVMHKDSRTPPPPPLRAARRLERAVGSYWSAHGSYVSRSAMQAGVLGAASDAVSQGIVGIPFDQHHVAALGLLAAVLSGGLNAVWLAGIEQAVPGSKPAAVFTKCLADFCVAGTIANSLYLVGVPLLTATLAGMPPDQGDLLSGWTAPGFRSVMLLEFCTFGPYNLIAFQLVPPQIRPLTAAAVSATCTVGLSAITLGHSFLGIGA